MPLFVLMTRLRAFVLQFNSHHVTYDPLTTVTYCFKHSNILWILLTALLYVTAKFTVNYCVYNSR